MSTITAEPALFPVALAFVLEHEGEGKITDDPRDPGGLTRWGISKRAYPSLDIRSLTQEQAAEIYLRDYWLPGGCGNLPPAVAMIHFDTAVNMGLKAAAKLLQQSVGVAVDGMIGPKTLAAVQRTRPRTLLVEYAARRLARYGSLETFPTFGLGWCRRTTACLAEALAMTEA